MIRLKKKWPMAFYFFSSLFSSLLSPLFLSPSPPTRPLLSLLSPPSSTDALPLPFPLPLPHTLPHTLPLYLTWIKPHRPFSLYCFFIYYSYSFFNISQPTINQTATALSIHLPLYTKKTSNEEERHGTSLYI